MNHDRSDFAAAVLLEKLAHDVYTERGPGAISRLQWSIMRCLARAEPAEKTPTWIARFVGVTTAPVSRALRSLESRGFVRMVRSTVDARQSIVVLTPAGENALAEDPLNRLAGTIARLAEPDRAHLKGALQQMGVIDLMQR